MSLFTRISSVRSSQQTTKAPRVVVVYNNYKPITLRGGWSTKQPTTTTTSFNRPFHTSPKVLNKEPPKKAPVATATATAQKAGQQVKNAVVDTSAKTVVRAPESLEDVKNSIASLLEDEIQTVKDQSMAVDVQTDFTKQFLAKSKYDVTEGKDGEVTMVRTQGSHTIKVIFNRNEPHENYDEEMANEEEEGAEEAEKANEDGVTSASDTLPAKQSIQIEVTFADKEGKWVLGGFAGKDNRLYIEDMSISHAKDAAQQEEERLDALPFETLSDDLQDRIYDFLDEVAVDDQLAHFVKHYTAESETKAAVHFLENLRGMLKK